MSVKSTLYLLFITGVLAGCSAEPKESTKPELTCPPVVGNTTMREASIWCQLKEGSDVKLYVTVLDSVSTPIQTVELLPQNLANSFKTDVYGLEPGSTYQYFVQSKDYILSDTVLIRTQPLWQYRTDPPDLRIMLGSCAYINELEYDRPGDSYGGGYEIFSSMASEDFDAMVWLGDNIYLREVDFGSIEGFAHRYSHARATPELHSLLKKGAHYAIWDDHDFGPNDSDGSWIHPDWSKTAFEAFWPNPKMGIPNAPELNASMVTIGDIDLFLLDNRTHRVNHTLGSTKRQLLGKEQFNWLLNSLKNSRARFKLVAIGGQMVSDAMIYENFAQFPEEQRALFTAIDDLDIHGLVFLTGDRHSAELSKILLPQSKNWVYDLTTSPLTSGSSDHSEEPNNNREPGTMVGERNYGLLSITGPRKNRMLKMQIKSVEGKVIWERNISASDHYEMVNL